MFETYSCFYVNDDFCLSLIMVMPNDLLLFVQPLSLSFQLYRRYIRATISITKLLQNNAKLNMTVNHTPLASGRGDY